MSQRTSTRRERPESAENHLNRGKSHPVFEFLRNSGPASVVQSVTQH